MGLNILRISLFQEKSSSFAPAIGNEYDKEDEKERSNTLGVKEERVVLCVL